jgi:AhpD family alkylhydroperoxidase
MIGIRFRLDVTKVSPDLFKAMASLEKYVEASGLEQKLLDLVKIRASQINGCAYCIVMHTDDARKHGENDEWMHLLNAWDEAPIYSARERGLDGSGDKDQRRSRAGWGVPRGTPPFF